MLLASVLQARGCGDSGSRTLCHYYSATGQRMSALLLSGRGVLVVGVEDDAATGCLRMYVGHRADGIYALIEDADAKEELRREWARSFTGHLVAERPPDNVLWTERERP